MVQPAKFVLRLPRDLHAAVKKLAAANGASLNTFVIETLAWRVGGHMPLVGQQYIPETHTGTHEEIVRGLLREALDIYGGNYMRDQAIHRELYRIDLALDGMGYDFFIGTFYGDDYGKAWVRKKSEPHQPMCDPDNKVCYCEEAYVEQDDEMLSEHAERLQERKEALEKSKTQECIFKPEVGKMVRYEGECYIVTAVKDGRVKLRPYCEADRTDD